MMQWTMDMSDEKYFTQRAHVHKYFSFPYTTNGHKYFRNTKRELCSHNLNFAK